jgi:endoglucanase
MHFKFSQPHHPTSTPQRGARLVLALTALLLAFLCPSAQAQGTGYWHTSSTRIVDANGTTVRIAGINWYGFETTNHLANGLWAQDYKTVLNTVKSLGYNVIRLPFSNEMVESNPIPSNYTTSASGVAANTALVGQTALQDMDTIISYAGSIGLRVILDNHRSEAGNSNEANGLWYTSAYPQANWIADWQTLAARYSASKFTFNGNPTVIGMDLRNEPHLIGNSGGYSGACWTGDTQTNGSYTGCPTSLTAQNWPVAAQAAGNAILGVNPKLLIFVEGNDCYNGTCAWQGENLMGVATNPVLLNVPNQLVYSPHDYGPNLFNQPWFNSTTTASSLDAVWNKFWGYISNAGTAPVWLGEFGTDNTSADVESATAGSQGQWFQSLVAYLQNSPAVDWTYWALNGEDSYGLLDSNYNAVPPSTLKQSLLASIQFPLSGGTTTPSFNLAPSVPTLAITPGTSATDTITVTGLNGFTGNVTLAASGLPSGVTAAFGTNPTTGSSVLTITASSTAAVGTATVTITGTSGSVTASTTIALTVNAVMTPSFTLSRTAPTMTLAPGQSAPDTVTVNGLGGFTGNVTLAASGLPSGVTAAFGTNPTTGSSVLTFTASSSAAAGTSTVTVTGTSGPLTASTTIALTVTGSSPAVGCRVLYTISPQNTSAFGAAIAIQNTGSAPINNWSLTWAFANGQTVTSLWNGMETQSGANVKVVNESYNGTIAPGATYSGVGFNGTWNGVTNAAPTSFAINGTTCSSLVITPSLPTLSIAPGGSASDTITVSGGFTGNVALSVSGLPSGVTAAFGTNPTTGSSALTFTASSLAAAGTSTVTITGTSAPLTSSTTIALTVGSAPSVLGCHVVYTISPQNTSAFGATLAIQNTGSTAINNWSLTWTFANGQTVSSLWNGTETQSGANVRVVNESYNGTIAAGATYSGVGFNGTWNGVTNAIPVSFAINGTTCH